MLASLNPRGILITAIFLLVMKEVHSDDFEAFKTMVLEKFQSLKEENVLLNLKLDNCQASASESSIEIQGLREKIIKQEENLNNTKGYVDNEIRPLINIGVETCQELSQRGVSKSGIYPIDPDGQDQNESPIQAFCHLPSGKTSLGETENIIITLCNEKFCYEHDVIHQTPIGQIQSLKDGSLSCHQEIVYSCKTAPWKVLNEDHLLIIGNDNSNHSLSDFGSDGKCNAVSFDWIDESVEITDMTILPIKGFKYGPLMSENQGARLKIGPLICIPPEDRYNNTQQLRIKALEENTQLNENALADQAATIAENQETFKTFSNTVATKTDLKNIETILITKLEVSSTKIEQLPIVSDHKSSELSKKKCTDGETGYKLVANNCYFFENVPLKRFEAIVNCASKFPSGGRLIEPRTTHLHDLIVEESASYFASSVYYAWIGVEYSQAKDAFIYTSDEKPVTIAKWYQKNVAQPLDNTYQKRSENYFSAFGFKTYKGWFNNFTTNKLPYVCEPIS